MSAMDTSDGNTSDSPAAQDDPGGTDNYVQRWYVRDQDGHPAHGMVQLVSRPDGGLLVQLDHIEEDDGSTIGSTALFFRPGEEAEAFISWMLHATRLTRPALRVLYDVFGEQPPAERTLAHLAGYAASRSQQ